MKVRILLLFLLLSGCAPQVKPTPPRDFSSSVTVTTVNGYVQSIDVYLPRDDEFQTTAPKLSVSVSEEKELNQLIESLKTTISELEDAKSRMLVVEEPAQ